MTRLRSPTEIDLQPAAVHGRSADMVMNAAYLVAENPFRNSGRPVAALQKEFVLMAFDP